MSQTLHLSLHPATDSLEHKGYLNAPVAMVHKVQSTASLLSKERKLKERQHPCLGYPRSPAPEVTLYCRSRALQDLGVHGLW